MTWLAWFYFSAWLVTFVCALVLVQLVRVLSRCNRRQADELRSVLYSMLEGVN